MPKDYELIEIFKAKASISTDIVVRIDAEYAWYAGASWEIASKIAMVDTILKNGLIPENFVVFVKLYRDYLNQQRKAWFASVGSTEITKLGFIQGEPRRHISAKPRIET